MLECCVTHDVASMHLDFKQAFPQASTKNDVFMEVLFGHDSPNGEHVLKLKKNFYGTCDDNLTCHECLKRGLVKRGFTALQIVPRLFCK